MRCKQMELLFSDYFDNTLSPGARAEVESHLVSCSRCAQEARSLQETVRLLGLRQPLEPPRELWSRLNVRIEQESSRSVSFWHRWRLPAMAAGALAASSAAGWLMMRTRTLEPVPVVDVQTPQERIVRNPGTSHERGIKKPSAEIKPSPRVRPAKRETAPKRSTPRYRRQRPASDRPVVLVQAPAAVKPLPDNPRPLVVTKRDSSASLEGAATDAHADRLAAAFKKDKRWMNAFREALVNGSKEIVREETTSRLLEVANQMRPLERLPITMFAPGSLPESPE